MSVPKCATHRDSPAVTFCAICGLPLCTECRVHVEKDSYCYPDAERKFGIRPSNVRLRATTQSELPPELGEELETLSAPLLAISSLYAAPAAGRASLATVLCLAGAYFLSFGLTALAFLHYLIWFYQPVNPSAVWAAWTGLVAYLLLCMAAGGMLVIAGFSVYSGRISTGFPSTVAVLSIVLALAGIPILGSTATVLLALFPTLGLVLLQMRRHRFARALAKAARGLGTPPA